jgi:hypothetical protein
LNFITVEIVRKLKWDDVATAAAFTASPLFQSSSPTCDL